MTGDYPTRACAARGKVISRGWWVVVSLEPIFYLTKYSLSELYFNTDRLLIEFNGLWYSLAAQQVFVTMANPDSLLFSKGLTTPETQTAPNHTPTMADTVPKWFEHAYSSTGT